MVTTHGAGPAWPKMPWGEFSATIHYCSTSGDTIRDSEAPTAPSRKSNNVGRRILFGRKYYLINNSFLDMSKYSLFL